jgi:hypothetical protein
LKNAILVNLNMRTWWQRCIYAALLNGLIWLTPPPVHFIALFLPFFSGYSIASSRCVKGLWASTQIGFIMGLTLGSTIMFIGTLAIAVVSWLGDRDTAIYFAVVIGVSFAIGGYTAITACIGALWAAYRRGPSIGRGLDRV